MINKEKIKFIVKKVWGPLLIVAIIGVLFWHKNAVNLIQEYNPAYAKVMAQSLTPGQLLVGERGIILEPEDKKEIGLGLGVKKDNEQIMIQPILSGVQSEPKKEQVENRLFYRDVYPNVDVEYLLFDGHIKENIILKNNQAPRQFVFDLKKFFPAGKNIVLRNDGGIFIMVVDKDTGEEYLSIDYPIAFDAKGEKYSFNYELQGDKLLMRINDETEWNRVVYPLIIDPPLTAREYDEVLLKIGQNDDKSANAKDGDVVMIKPAGWPWGDMEYRDYVIVRVPKLTEKEREKYMAVFKGVSDEERGQIMINRLQPPIDPAPQLRNTKTYGVDYVSLLEDKKVIALELKADKSEEEISKDGLVSVFRDRAQEHPIIDATELSLVQIFQEKKFASLFRDIKSGKSKLAFKDLPNDESVLPTETRLTKRLEEKQSWLAVLRDKIIKPAMAATTNTYSIGTNSRNYSTIQAWENARDGNLVSSNYVEKGECYKDSTFTAGVTIDGSTTDSTRYMWLTVASGNRHTGTAGTGVIINPSSNSSVILVSDDYSIVEWLEITGYSTGESNYDAITLAYSSYSTARYNLIHDNVYYGGSYGIGHYDTGGSDNIYNNIIYGGTEIQAYSDGIYNYWASSGINVYNNTIYLPMSSGGSAGVWGGGNSSSGILAKNNIVVETSADAVAFVVSDSSSFGSSDYNASSDTSSPGAHSLDNITAGATFTTTTVGSENLHLKAGASSINAGVDLSAVFTTDIDAETRPTGAGTWDIGADEIVSAATNNAPTISAISDNPDPIGVGADITFSATWSDADTGEKIKVIVCQGSGITTSTAVCKDGEWARSDVCTNRSPETTVYKTVAGDKNNTRNYWIFVCDDSLDATTGCSLGSSGSFSVANQRPDGPIDLLVEGRSKETAFNLEDTTPEFSAVYKDSQDEGDVAEKYCIQVNAVADFSGTNYWYSDGANCYGGTSLASNVSESLRTVDVSYAGTELALDGSTYYWRYWLWDEEERSATSSVSWFKMADTENGAGVRLKGGTRLNGGVRVK